MLSTKRYEPMMFAVVDCDNCFVSCERVFQPELLGKPVLVLSNNDGCVVARSNEAKALGIKMGVPVFQIKDLCRQYDVQLRSSNYVLYADMSNIMFSYITKDEAVGFTFNTSSITASTADVSKKFFLES